MSGRKARTRFTSEQVAVLEGSYREGRLSSAGTSSLATRLGLQQETVRVWFKNRRAKDRRDPLWVEETVPLARGEQEGATLGEVVEEPGTGKRNIVKRILDSRRPQDRLQNLRKEEELESDEVKKNQVEVKMELEEGEQPSIIGFLKQEMEEEKWRKRMR